MSDKPIISCWQCLTRPTFPSCGFWRVISVFPGCIQLPVPPHHRCLLAGGILAPDDRAGTLLQSLLMRTQLVHSKPSGLSGRYREWDDILIYLISHRNMMITSITVVIFSHFRMCQYFFYTYLCSLWAVFHVLQIFSDSQGIVTTDGKKVRLSDYFKYAYFVHFICVLKRTVSQDFLLCFCHQKNPYSPLSYIEALLSMASNSLRYSNLKLATCCSPPSSYVPHRKCLTPLTVRKNQWNLSKLSWKHVAFWPHSFTAPGSFVNCSKFCMFATTVNNRFHGAISSESVLFWCSSLCTVMAFWRTEVVQKEEK